jgi:hypothetical protein
MKKQILHFLVVISLVFNLAFIGMFLWHRTHAPIGVGRPEFPHIREKLQEHHDEMEGLRKGFMDQRKSFMEFLKGDDFNEATADSMLQSMLKKQLEMEEAFGKKLIEMKKNGEFRDERFPEPPHERRNRPKRRRK